ncbi:glycoside hydrolase family 65 protein [Nonomuraea sediminis]|uniref:glycoside hydrolase family 65 protein n=1 Tax=Nonomuraea sediminis TaxID=2835864 RepID=UPI001BDCDCF6|nr:glycosyl hydrolase family 65 protein [Nonomuraea sediminis]
MIEHPAYPAEPWQIRETSVDLDRLAQSESVFALSNGHIGLRGNLDEGEPYGLPGTYLNGVYETRPLPYAEGGYGYPETDETVVNITNGKLIRLLVDDEPLDMRYGTVEAHERILDLRAGTLTRHLSWTTPTGRRVQVTSTRLVSLEQRAVVAIRYEVTAVDQPVLVVVQSELVANETVPTEEDDPRAAAALAAPLEAEYDAAEADKAILVHSVRRSRLRLAAAMTNLVDGPARMHTELNSSADLARYTVAANLEPGEKLQLVKLVGYGWSRSRSVPALRDQVAAALTAAELSGWEGLAAGQRHALDDFWSRADVEIDGDVALQQAVRFGLFHILQASARAEHRPIPAKGLTGSGYDGHVFWDTEAFVLPVLTHTAPKTVASALQWRRHTLPIAQDRARQLGLEGAAFPWRTIHGMECSGYWPAGTAAFHLNADIAGAVIRYVRATGDTEFEADCGLDLLVETARLWRSLGHHDKTGAFRIDGVTGPDEYSAIADNNVYTNLMARRNLAAAADVVARYPDHHDVSDEEAASWRDAAEAMTIPYDRRQRVHPQAEGFTAHAEWDFAKDNRYPLMLNYPYFELYRRQVVKQADLVLAMHLAGEAFTPEQKARNFAYYERLTVRDSSLSACTQAVLAAEVGHLDLAHAYLAEAALMDLDDLEHNTRDGLHLAALAGGWIALVEGFGGMRLHDSELCFAPRLPDALSRLAFRLAYRGRRLRVTVTHASATYELVEGEPLHVTHYGKVVKLGAEPVKRPLPPLPDPGPTPEQPPGREPPLGRDIPTPETPAGGVDRGSRRS